MSKKMKMNIMLSFVNSFFVTVLMTFLNSTLEFPDIVFSILEAWIVSFVSLTLLPIQKLVFAVTKNQKNNFIKNLINNIPICLFMSLVLSLFFAIKNLGFTFVSLIVGMKSILFAFIISYIVSVICTPILDKLIKK